MNTHQLGKKQKTDDDNENESWETMSDNQQNEMYHQHYKSVEKIIDEDKDMEDLDKDQINDKSIGTIDDYTINTMSDFSDDPYNPTRGKFLTVQVSTKLNNEERELDEEEIFENIAGSCAKFIMIWMKEKFVTGVIHNESNKITDDICGFNS